MDQRIADHRADVFEGLGKIVNLYPMLKPSFVSVAMLLGNLAFAQTAPVIDWQHAYGGSLYEKGYAVRQTGDGGYVLAGTASSNDGDVSGNHGYNDLWIIKLDPTGLLEWQRSYGGSSGDEAWSIDPTLDGGYIVAGVTLSSDGDVVGDPPGADCWVIKLDGNGDLEWQKALGGSGVERLYAIEQTTDGGYIMTGQTNSNNGDVSGNHGLDDVWIVKLDAMGTILWQRCLGGSNYDIAQAIQQTIDGGFVIAGWTSSNDGDVSGNHGSADFWVVKTDTAGIIQWQSAIGGSADETAFSVLQTIDHGFIVAGWSDSNDGDVSDNQGLHDLWIVKLDVNGTLQWQAPFGGTDYDLAYSVQQTADEGFVIGGRTESNDGDVTGNHGQSDVWLLKVDANGTLLWQTTLGGSDDDRGNAIQITTDGGYIVAGEAQSLDGDVTGNHGYDLWVIKLAADYNTITGSLFLDPNSNGMQDAGELSLAARTVHASGTGRFSISQPNGSYALTVLDTGNFSSEPTPLNYYSTVPGTQPSYFPSFGMVDSLNAFAFQPVVVANDLLITITPVTPFRPGHYAMYDLYYANIGTTALVGTVKFYPHLPIVGFSSASLVPSMVSPDSVAWTTPVLDPYHDGHIQVTVLVNPFAPLFIPVYSTARIEPVLGDAEPVNNEDGALVAVTGSFDPNDILVDRPSLLLSELSSPPFLEYAIRFQNTGTDTAFTVKIRDPLPGNADPSTFQFVNSSHPVQLQYNNEGHVLWFEFENILLPDSNVNEPASHGFVRYRIKPLSDLVVGDSILNQAAIFFDFNAPVPTNTASTVIETTTAVPFVDIVGLMLYPNPATGTLAVSCNIPVYDADIVIADTYGREVFRDKMQGTGQSLDLRGLAKGSYLFSLSSTHGSSIQRLVLQ